MFLKAFVKTPGTDDDGCSLLWLQKCSHNQQLYEESNGTLYSKLLKNDFRWLFLYSHIAGTRDLPQELHFNFKQKYIAF